MMEGWMREREAAIARGEVNYLDYTEPGNGGRNGTPQPFSPPKPPLTPSPFAPVTGSPSSPPAGAGDLPPQPRHRHRRGRRPRREPHRPRRPPEGRRPERRRGSWQEFRDGSQRFVADTLGECALRGKEDQHPTSAAGLELQVVGGQPRQESQGWVGAAGRPAGGPSPGSSGADPGRPGRQRTQMSPGGEGLPQSPFVPLDSKARKIRCRKRRGGR